MNETIEKLEIEPGYSVTITSLMIMPGVTVRVYDDETAGLVIGSNEIVFEWNAVTKAMVENIDTVESIELLVLLAEHSVSEQ